MVNDVPLFLNGEFESVRQLEPSGEAHVEEVDFAGVGTFPVFPYPHPETITLPTRFPSLRHVTNRGVIFPLSYFLQTQDLVRVGLGSEAPVLVGDRDVRPVDVAIALPAGATSRAAEAGRGRTTRRCAARRRGRSQGRRAAHRRPPGLLTVGRRG
ncbi:MAG: hypothetical protein R2731_19950 [Nocardioides sp.]